jgi:hypothetical protein
MNNQTWIFRHDGEDDSSTNNQLKALNFLKHLASVYVTHHKWNNVIELFC